MITWQEEINDKNYYLSYKSNVGRGSFGKEIIETGKMLKSYEKDKNQKWLIRAYQKLQKINPDSLLSESLVVFNDLKKELEELWGS